MAALTVMTWNTSQYYKSDNIFSIKDVSIFILDIVYRTLPDTNGN
jgi:hypothetical protein